MKSHKGKLLILLLVLIIGIPAITAIAGYGKPSGVNQVINGLVGPNLVASNNATLTASPVSHVVQMFDSISIDAQMIKEFPNGTLCSKLSSPVDGSAQGAIMTFYRLDCGGTLGFVGAKWISRF